MLHKNIRILTWFNFFTDFKLYAPIAIIYFTQISGSFALGMSILSLQMLSSAFFEIPTGVLSDRMGRKKTIVMGAIAAVFYSIFYAIGQSYWILALGAIFEGLSRSFYSGNNDALLHDTLSETKQEHTYEEHLGKVSAMFQMALAVSAIMGSIVASWSFPIVMWASVVPQLLCVFLALGMIEPPIHTRKSGNVFAHLTEAYQNFVRNKKLRLLSLASILEYGFGEAGYQFQAAFYTTVWPLWAIGIAKTISNLLGAASFHFSGKLLQRFGTIRILVIGNLYNRITKLVAVGFPSVVSPIVISSSSAFFGVERVAINSLMQKEFTHEQRATMGSLNSLAMSIFFSISALGMGLIADVLSPSHAFLILQGFQCINLWIFWKFKKA